MSKSAGQIDGKTDRKDGQIDGKTVGKRFTGKVAIVTGSSEGIGYGIAYRLAQEGAHVVVSSRRKEAVEAAVKKIKEAGFSASGLVVDVVKASDRKALLDHTLAIGDRKTIDVLVNNVGTGNQQSLLETTSEQWDELFNINVKSSWELVKETTPYIPKGGSILFNGSVVGYAPGPPMSLYGITKTLIAGLVPALSKELAPKGIRVNSVAPGPIFTPAFDRLKDIEVGPGVKFVDVIPTMTTLKRLGTIEEIGAVAAFLASDDAGYITGETITAGGGAGARI